MTTIGLVSQAQATNLILRVTYALNDEKLLKNISVVQIDLSKTCN